MQRLAPLTRPFVKLVIPSAGVFALYLGGLFGVWLATRGRTPASWFTVTFSTLVFSTAAAFGALLAADSALGAEASHVDTLKTLGWMVLAWLGVLLERQLGEKIGWALPPFLENLIIWGAGAASIWEEEPGFPGWKPALRTLKDRLFQGPQR